MFLIFVGKLYSQHIRNAVLTPKRMSLHEETDRNLKFALQYAKMI